MQNAELLDVNLGASVFELLLEVSSFSLRNGFLDRLRSAFDQVLGFLEAETGDGADFLDDVDLVGASVNEDNVKFGLFFFDRSSSTGAASSSNSYRSSCRNAPLLFEQLESSAASRTVSEERSSTIFARSAILLFLLFGSNWF